MAHPRLRRCTWLLLVLAAVPAWGQMPRVLPPPKPLDANTPRDCGTGDKPDAPAGPDILPKDYGGYLPCALPVKLVDVLKLATLANLDIVQANLAVERARVALYRARAYALPNLNLGSTYVAHDGQIQNTAGNVQTVNRDSLFVGGGPSLSVDISAALFGPDEARKLLDAARYGHMRVTNETLQRVADAYFVLLRARRRLAVLDESIDFLTSERETDLRANTTGLLPLIKSFVKAGTALPSDQARVEADVVRATEARVRALEDVRVASAELARLLHLNALAFLLPAEDYRWPLLIPGEAWFCQPPEELVALALRSRPELAESQAVVEAAVARYRAAWWRPALPNVIVNYQWGGFGGGPAVVRRNAAGANVLGDSGTIADFGTRDDFDISLVWRLQNMGLGNAYATRDAKYQVEQTKVSMMLLQDRAIAQVVQLYEQVKRSKQRVDLTRAGLFDEEGKPTGAIYRSIRLNFLRIKQGQGVPLEVLDSIRRLGDVLDSYAQALTDHDRSRFSLLIAVGMPAGALIDPGCMPVPPAPPPPNIHATASVQQKAPEAELHAPQGDPKKAPEAPKEKAATPDGPALRSIGATGAEPGGIELLSYPSAASPTWAKEKTDGVIRTLLERPAVP
jgi:outer membrane protein TolC